MTLKVDGKLVKGWLRGGRRNWNACEPSEDRVSIRYGAARAKDGWMPVTKQGHRRSWAGVGFGKGVEKNRALRTAKADAIKQARRYSGDFCVIVNKGRPPEWK